MREPTQGITIMSQVPTTRQSALRPALVAALDQLGSFVAGPRELSLSADGVQLQCEIHSADQLALAVQRSLVTVDKLRPAPLAKLQTIAATLAKRLTYLLEPISPIETDQEQCIVQMRSNPPSKGDDGTTYYELLVRRGGELELVRFSKIPGQVRQTIPATLTREVFLRLTADLANAGG
jgi:hypothetical protein